jgi:hypothetical protein
VSSSALAAASGSLPLVLSKKGMIGFEVSAARSN